MGIDMIKKDLNSRREEIQKELRFLYKANLKITNWDVPEADEREAKMVLVDILQEGLDAIREEIDN